MATEQIQAVKQHETHVEALDGGLGADEPGGRTDVGRNMLHAGRRAEDALFSAGHHRGLANRLGNNVAQNIPPHMAFAQRARYEELSHHPSTQRVPDRAATILSPALAATGEMRPAPPSGSIIGTGIAHGVAWLRTPPAPGARLGRVYIWHRQGSAWARFAVAAESAALESRGMPQQMGLYYAVPGGFTSRSSRDTTTLGQYTCANPSPAFATEDECMAWVTARQHTGRTLVCRLPQGWVANSPGDEGGTHLYYVNDYTGTGQLQNVIIGTTGDFRLEGDANCFNPRLADLHPHNLAAELLTDYGPGFFQPVEVAEYSKTSAVHEYSKTPAMHEYTNTPTVYEYNNTSGTT